MPKSTPAATGKRGHAKISRKAQKAHAAALDAKLLKPRRNKPGMRSLRQTRKQLKSTEPALKHPGTLRYMRAVMREFNEDNQDYRVGDRAPLSDLGSKVPKISDDAVNFLREYMERELVRGVNQAYQLSLDDGLQSLTPGNLRRARTFDVFHEKPDNPVARVEADRDRVLPASATY